MLRPEAGLCAGAPHLPVDERHTDPRDMRCAVPPKRCHRRRMILLEKASHLFVHVQSSVCYRIPMLPSTLIALPVIYSAHNHARWATTAAISASSPVTP